jgi:hypothetical protein
MIFWLPILLCECLLEGRLRDVLMAVLLQYHYYGRFTAAFNLYIGLRRQHHPSRCSCVVDLYFLVCITYFATSFSLETFFSKHSLCLALYTVIFRNE